MCYSNMLDQTGIVTDEKQLIDEKSLLFTNQR